MGDTQRIDLNELISPAAARVVVHQDKAGRIQDAVFDLAGLPRVDQLLVGHPVTEVPSLVERLCGICPAAHHLAGVAALEGVLGVRKIPAAARLQRRILHFASVLDNHAIRLFGLDRELALRLRKLAKQAMMILGSPGHFPATAIPGGVVQRVTPAEILPLVDDLQEALFDTNRLVKSELEKADPSPVAPYAGAEVALVDDSGHPDLFGTRLRAARSGEPVLDDISPDQWADSVVEARDGDAAPRPYLRALGAETGSYRVGPISQLRIGALTTPYAAQLQEVWQEANGTALAARSVLAVHCIEVLIDVLSEPKLTSKKIATPLPERPSGITEGTGWVDGPRGLLVHHYRADEKGILVSAQILTPTAQNERWLAEMLQDAVSDQATAKQAAEASIREADPCLPCTSTPPGEMDLTIDVKVD